MIIKYKCKYCKSNNKFKPEETKVALSEKNNIDKNKTYFPKCNKCGKKNAVKAK